MFVIKSLRYLGGSPHEALGHRRYYYVMKKVEVFDDVVVDYGGVLGATLATWLRYALFNSG